LCFEKTWYNYIISNKGIRMAGFKTESKDDRVDLLIKFKVGEPLLDSKGTFLGLCVNNLSDLDESWTDETLNTIKSAGACEIARRKNNEMSRMEMFGYRKVFTKEFGSTEQLLSNNIDRTSLVWVNVNMQDYNFDKVVDKIPSISKSKSVIKRK
jgi:hypothetical protein